MSSNLLKPPPEAKPLPPRPPPGSAQSRPHAQTTHASTSGTGTAGTAQRGPSTQGTGPARAAGSGPDPFAAITDASVKAEVAYIERVRATCGILNIGQASDFNKQRPDMVQAALNAVKSRLAYRANAYADDVAHYLPQLPQQQQQHQSAVAASAGTKA